MAVNSLHEKNPRVIHRDLKSLNVLLSDDLKIVKLCDLGLVRLKDKDLIESKLGSPLWMVYTHTSLSSRFCVCIFVNVFVNVLY